MNYKNFFKLLVSIIICELAGVIGAFFTTPEIGVWYKTLNKPSFNPPNWIFGPVWTTLFVLMGISLYLVWVKNWEPRNKIGSEKVKTWNSLTQRFFTGDWQKANIVIIFAVQLILNILWSIVFFNAHSPFWAFVVLLMLWFAIVYTIVNFYRVSKIAALLLVPYILWVSFAGVVNLAIFLLN